MVGGNRRKTILLEEDTGLDSIIFENGSVANLIAGLSGAIRGKRANFITLKDENGDVIEIDTRDGSCRVLYTAGELEEKI